MGTSIDTRIYSNDAAYSLICSVVERLRGKRENFLLTCKELHANSIAQICKCDKKFKSEFISKTRAREKKEASDKEKRKFVVFPTVERRKMN